MKKKLYIALSTVFFTLLVITALYFIFRDKKEEVFFEYDAVMMKYQEDSNEMTEEGHIRISLKGTVDLSKIDEMSERGHAFEGTVTIGDDEFDIYENSENTMSVVRFDDNRWMFTCFENHVEGQYWFYILSDGLEFDNVVVAGMRDPDEWKYTGYYFVAPAKDKEQALEIFKKLGMN